jgi:hypothetical protein
MAKDISKKDLAAKKARRAQKEMLAYMEENNLDPKKDWTGHKKHGKKIQAWIDVINLGNKKARELNEEKAIEKSKKNKKPEVHPKKENITSIPNAYDYPTVDGREMTSDQKKKYRQKMRTLMKTMSKEKAEAEGKKYAAELVSSSTVVPKKEKKEEPAKEKKAEKPAKEGKDKKKKKKKAKKEED